MKAHGIGFGNVTVHAPKAGLSAGTFQLINKEVQKATGGTASVDSFKKLSETGVAPKGEFTIKVASKFDAAVAAIVSRVSGATAAASSAKKAG